MRDISTYCRDTRTAPQHRRHSINTSCLLRSCGLSEQWPTWQADWLRAYLCRQLPGNKGCCAPLPVLLTMLAASTTMGLSATSARGKHTCLPQHTLRTFSPDSWLGPAVDDTAKGLLLSYPASAKSHQLCACGGIKLDGGIGDAAHVKSCLLSTPGEAFRRAFVADHHKLDLLYICSACQCSRASCAAVLRLHQGLLSLDTLKPVCLQFSRAVASACPRPNANSLSRALCSSLQLLAKNASMRSIQVVIRSGRQLNIGRRLLV